MKKILLILMLGIFLISSVNAIDNLGIFQQNTDVELIQTCDCTSVNITKIKLGNGTLITFNSAMTANGKFFNFTLSSVYTFSLGEYLVNGEGNPNGVYETFSYTFNTNYRGDSVTSAQAFIYLGLIVIIIFVFIITIFGIDKLPKSNEQDEQGKILSITYLKYLRPVGWMFEWMLIVGILFLSSNLAFAYLNEQLFANILFTLFNISLALTPVIVTLWIVWIFVRMFHDKEMQKLLNRGIFPQGRV